MNTLTIEEVITQMEGRLLEKGFSMEEVPTEERNYTLNVRLPKGYKEYRVMYGRTTVCFIELLETKAGNIQTYLLRMLPEFDKVDNTGDIENIVRDYNEVKYK